jgi:uncharacterized protein (TIGR02271 family)
MVSTSITDTTVVAYFSTEPAAQNAVDQLRIAGFTASQIGVATRGSSDYSSLDTARKPVAQESAWDKFKNFFSSDPVEPYADERTRGEFASHEITTGDEYSNEDLNQSLTGLSVPEERSRYFGHRIGRGDQGAVVTVRAAGREEEAQRILVENGGDLGDDYAGYDYSDAGETVSGEKRIQLLGEVLRVHKDRISRGEVRIRKEVITETQMVEVPVTREELVIERTIPADIHTAAGQVGEGSEIRIPLSEEVASADKDTIVREEVTVGKRAVQSVANVGETISREELVVEDSTRNPERTRRTA